MKLLQVLLFFLLITLPLGVVIRIGIFPSAYIYPVDVAIGCIALWSIFLYWKRSLSVPKNILKAYGIFIAVLCVSLLLNVFHLNLTEFISSALYLIRFVLYSNLLFIPFLFPEKTRKKYVVFLTCSGFVTILFGYIQYVYYPALRNLYYLGWDEHLYRMFSTFLDPNFAGIFFVLVFWGLVQVFINYGLIHNGNPSLLDQVKDGLSSSPKGRGNYKKSSLALRERVRVRGFFYGIAIIFTSIAIFLTYSRSTYIAFVVSVCVYLFLLRNKLITFALVILIVLSFLLIPKNLGGEGLNFFRTRSIFTRTSEYSYALTIFTSSPLYGVGFDAYRYAQRDHGFLTQNWQENHSGAGVPDSYLFILATSGIAGFAAFLYFWYTIVKQLWKFQPESRNFLLVSLTALGVHSLFENSLFYPFIMIWIFLLLGLMLT